MLPIVVDYSPTPFGTWLGVLNIAGHSARRVQAADAHQALHAVLDELEVVADETGRNLATVHQLDGDPEAWAQLAVENDFVHCAMQTGTKLSFSTEALRGGRIQLGGRSLQTSRTTPMAAARLGVSTPSEPTRR